MLRGWLMPARGAYAPHWAAFAKAFNMQWVDTACPGFRERWHYILVQTYHKRCLDTSHKWKITSNPPAEVRWMGGEKPLPQEWMVNNMWAAASWAAEEAGMQVAPLNPPAVLGMHQWKVPCVAPLEDILILQS